MDDYGYGEGDGYGDVGHPANFAPLRRHLDRGMVPPPPPRVPKYHSGYTYAVDQNWISKGPMVYQRPERYERHVPDQVRRAQKEAAAYMKKIQESQQRAKANAAAFSTENNPGENGAIHFEGAWVDEKGNSVLVHASDAYKWTYTARLSRPNRPALVLDLQWWANDQVWYCGNAWLDEYQSTGTELHWHRTDGRVTTWERALPQELVTLRPNELTGAWVDSSGNSVQIYSVDAWSVDLVATLSRSRGPDAQLKMTPSEDGGWYCGNSALDRVSSTDNELHWVRGNGHVSVWTRGKV